MANVELHADASVEELIDDVQILAKQLQIDVANRQWRAALAAIRTMERALTTLEFEFLDGEDRGEDDAC